MGRVALVGVALAVAALLTWWLVDGRAAPVKDDVDRGDRREDERNDPLRVGLEGSGTPDGPPEGSGGDDGDAPPDAPPAKHVKGRIVGISREDLGRAEVQVVALKQFGWVEQGIEAAPGHIRADRSYFADLGVLFDTGRPFTEIRVEVNHPDFLVGRAVVDVSKAREGSAPFAFEADVELERAHVITGRVINQDGVPLPRIRIAAYRFMDGEVPQDPMTEEARAADELYSDADGRFRIRVGEAGEWLVVIAHKARLPWSEIITLRERSVYELGDVALDPGLQISGRVTLNGEPLEGARVKLDFGAWGLDLPAWGRDLELLADGTVVALDTEVKTDADGRYVATGLEPRAHSVRVMWIDGVAIWSGVKPHTRVVDPPAAGADIAIECVALDVRVVSEDRPVDGAYVKIRKGNVSIDGQTDGAGRLRFLLPGEFRWSLVASKPRFATVARELEGLNAPVRREEVIDLGAEIPRATLVVRLTDPEGKPITRARLEFRKANQERGIDMSGRGDRESDDGVYRFEDAPLGKMILHVAPGRRALEFKGYWVDIDAPVECAPGETVELELTPEVGGRVRILIKDADGETTGAECEILDQRGDKVKVAFVGGDEKSITMSIHAVDAGWSTVEPPLAPGRYEVVVRPGDTTLKTVVSVKAGETTDVEFIAPK